MRFKIGQEVVCAVDGTWVGEHGEITRGPKYGDIVTVEGYEVSGGEEFLFFYEYTEVDKYGERESFFEPSFEPLADISELEEILNEETMTV